MRNNICIYFRTEPEKDRFFWGDRYLRKVYRFLFRPQKISGVNRVFFNLCKSFDLLNIKYTINKPFHKITNDDIPIVLGVGKYSLKDYDRPNPIIAGIALMTHPSEWPNLCKEYPIAKYLQHSIWANDVYKKYYGNKICDTWFSGIDTNFWKPKNQSKEFDFLIYNKIRWNKKYYRNELIVPIKKILDKKKISYTEILYGSYTIERYKELLNRSKNILYLCEHESQGFAYCEALSMNVPVLAWDQETCLDPNRFEWNDPIIQASSVPFLTDKGGVKFKGISEFKQKLNLFLKLEKLNSFTPREYIINTLSLEQSGKRMIDIIKQVYPNFEHSNHR